MHEIKNIFNLMLLFYNLFIFFLIIKKNKPMKKTMNKDDFLQIFKTGFHKLSLKKLVKIRDE
jgi:hypothetical protein